MAVTDPVTKARNYVDDHPILNLPLLAAAFAGGNEGAAEEGEVEAQELASTLEEMFSTKAPFQVEPGIDSLEGQYVNDLGQVQPWAANYDEYGRLIARTDFNAGNAAAGIPDIHFHTYEWGPGMTPLETGSHIPGVWPGR
jgi:hypothetical protein